jgi:hypothetical protein
MGIPTEVKSVFKTNPTAIVSVIVIAVAIVLLCVICRIRELKRRRRLGRYQSETIIQDAQDQQTVAIESPTRNQKNASSIHVVRDVYAPENDSGIYSDDDEELILARKKKLGGSRGDLNDDEE